MREKMWKLLSSSQCKMLLLRIFKESKTPSFGKFSIMRKKMLNIKMEGKLK
jgi:hypothetical protein